MKATLAVDDKRFDIDVLDRPSIDFDEVYDENGVYKLQSPGKWNPIQLHATDFEFWDGEKNVSLSFEKANETETWELFDCSCSAEPCTHDEAMFLMALERDGRLSWSNLRIRLNYSGCRYHSGVK